MGADVVGRVVGRDVGTDVGIKVGILVGIAVGAEFTFRVFDARRRRRMRNRSGRVSIATLG